MRRFALSPDVEADLDEIWQRIAQDNIHAADDLEERLFAAIELLARDPEIGHTRTDLTHLDLRFWPVGSYLIIHRIVARELQIVAVVHGARDLPRILRSR